MLALHQVRCERHLEKQRPLRVCPEAFDLRHQAALFRELFKLFESEQSNRADLTEIFRGRNFLVLIVRDPNCNLRQDVVGLDGLPLALWAPRRTTFAGR